MPRGKAEEPSSTTVACVLLLKALDSLLLYSLCSVVFLDIIFTSRTLSICLCAHRRWLLPVLDHGREDEKGGWGIFQPLPARDKPLPRQEFTSSMKLVPSFGAGTGLKILQSSWRGLQRVCGEMRQPWSTEPCCPLWAGCPSPIRLFPPRGQSPCPMWGRRLLGPREGGWEMLCPLCPGSGWDAVT